MTRSASLHPRWRLALVSSDGAFIYRAETASPGLLDTPGRILRVPDPAGDRECPVVSALPAKVRIHPIKSQSDDLGIRDLSARITACRYPSGRPWRLLLYALAGSDAVLRHNGAVQEVLRTRDAEEWHAIADFGGTPILLPTAGDIFGATAKSPALHLPVLYSAGSPSGGPGNFPAMLIFERTRASGPGESFAALYVISQVPLAEIVGVYENGRPISGDPLVLISANDPVPLDPDFSAFGPPMAFVFFRRRPEGAVTVDARSFAVSPITAVHDFLQRFAGWLRFDPLNAATDAQLHLAGIYANYYFTQSLPMASFLKQWQQETGLETHLTPEMHLRIRAREPRSLVHQALPEVTERHLRSSLVTRFQPAHSPRSLTLATNYSYAQRASRVITRYLFPSAPRDAPVMRLERRFLWMDPAVAQAILNDIAPSYSGWSVTAPLGVWDGDAIQPGRIATIAGYTVEVDEVTQDVARAHLLVGGRIRAAPPAPAFPLPLRATARASLTPIPDCASGNLSLRCDPGQTVYFRVCPEGGSGDFEVRWNFGDGHTATGFAPGHIFANSGRYIVRTTVTDRLTGGTADATVTVISQAPLLACALLWRCFSSPLRVTHESDTLIPPTAYGEATAWADGDISAEWDWGDGSLPSPGFRASHDYAFQNTPSTEYAITFRMRRGSEIYEDTGPRMGVQEPFASGGRAVRAMVSLPGGSRSPCIHREHRWYTDTLPLTLEFSAQLIHWRTPLISWIWADGSPSDPGNPVSHTFTDYGNYLVRAVVSESGAPPVVTDALRIVIRPLLLVQAEACVNDADWIPLPASLRVTARDLVRVRVTAITGGDGRRVPRWQLNGAVFGFGDQVALYLHTPGTHTVSVIVADAQGATSDINPAGLPQTLTVISD
ncbi:MAG: PKD domain-containing protein [bacterium JZ-2024 1]